MHKNGFSKILILIVALVAVVGGFLIWTFLQDPIPLSEPIVYPDLEGGNGIDEEGIVQGETADWQIYRNKEYGFEVKLPGNWSIFDPIGSDQYRKLDLISNTETAIFTPIDLLENPFLIEEEAWLKINRENGEYFIKDSKDVDDFWNKLGKKNERTGEIVNRFIERKIIDDVEFIFFEQYAWQTSLQKQIWIPQALFMYGENFFWVRGSAKVSLIFFNQMLSTFRFLD